MDLPSDADDARGAPSRPEAMELTFSPPLRLSGVQYATAVLREPTVGEVLRATERGSVYEQMQALISMVAGIPRGALGAMSASTYKSAERFFITFLVGEVTEPEDADEGAEPVERLVIEFAEPIEVGSNKRSSVTVTEPSLSMLAMAAKAGSPLAEDVQLLAMATLQSGGSVALVEQMRFSDFARGRKFLQGFTTASAPIA